MTSTTSTTPSTSRPKVAWVPDRVQFFRGPKELRAWFATNHTREREIWIGFYKAHTGRQGLTYLQAVEEALCFGWIDTTVRRIDEERYTNRFVPRRPGSAWSRVNREKFRELADAGRVAEAGHVAFGRGTRPSAYSYERRLTKLPRAYLARLRANPRAWSYFSTQPPGFQRLVAYWIMNAQREVTRERRLAELIATSAEGQRPRAFVVERSVTRAGTSGYRSPSSRSQ